MVHSEIRNINIIWLKRLIMVLCQIGLMGSISILAQTNVLGLTNFPFNNKSRHNLH